MTVDTSTPRTRRAILAASLGGAAAFVANAVGRAAPVNAADGQAMLVGGEYTAESKTFLGTNANDYAFWGSSAINIGVVGTSTSSNGVQGETGSGVGVLGYGGPSGKGVVGQGVAGNIGVEGTSEQGTGVNGSGNTGVRGTGVIGVHGHATTGTGVYGDSDTGAGVLAQSNVGVALRAVTTGVQTAAISAQVGPNTIPTPPAKTGVYGRSVVDSGSRGIFGETTNGRGVNGIATSGRGVHGEATSGLGVRGYATSGTGVSAEASTGYALRTKGRVRLENSAGLATIASGTSSVVVTPGIDLTTTSAVVATLNGNAGTATVRRVAINATNNTFTIFLTANATATVKVAWIVLG